MWRHIASELLKYFFTSFHPSNGKTQHIVQLGSQSSFCALQNNEKLFAIASLILFCAIMGSVHANHHRRHRRHRQRWQRLGLWLSRHHYRTLFCLFQMHNKMRNKMRSNNCLELWRWQEEWKNLSSIRVEISFASIHAFFSFLFKTR